MEYVQFVLIVLLSPLLQGMIRKMKALMQGRVGPGILLPYYDMVRLMRKDMVVSDVTSWVFRAAPYTVFASTVAAAMLVPVITTKGSLWFMGDILALIYLLALGRFSMALAGLDAGTAFGGEGSSREMTVATLVEPMLVLSIFTVAISTGSTNVARIAESGPLMKSPSHMLALAAFLVAVIAETGRIPVDNPDTHLELTMIHEGMLLEYSGRYLALMEWSSSVKQMLLFTLAADLFFPFGLAASSDAPALSLAAGSYLVKMGFLACLAALVESTRSKMRFFQLPSLLGGAFVLALLSLLTYLMLGR